MATKQCRKICRNNELWQLRIKIIRKVDYSVTGKWLSTNLF